MSDNNTMICPICGNSATCYSQAVYYFKNSGKNFIPIFYCKKCNSFIKNINDDQTYRYFNNSKSSNVYNDLTKEGTAFKYRINFFEYLYSLLKKHNSSVENWLDFGSAYGHLCNFLKSQNIKSIGIENSDIGMDFSKSNGLEIYKRTDDLPKGISFDVISLIDSLYYTLSPNILIHNLHQVLGVDGLIILRVSTRNWLIKFNKYILRNRTDRIMGDHTISYSRKSISYLLENNGFEIIKLTNIEKGKNVGMKIWYFYLFSRFVKILSLGLINCTPGLIVIARKIELDKKSN